MNERLNTLMYDAGIITRYMKDIERLVERHPDGIVERSLERTIAEPPKGTEHSYTQFKRILNEELNTHYQERRSADFQRQQEQSKQESEKAHDRFGDVSEQKLVDLITDLYRQDSIIEQVEQCYWFPKLLRDCNGDKQKVAEKLLSWGIAGASSDFMKAVIEHPEGEVETADVPF